MTTNFDYASFIIGIGVAVLAWFYLFVYQPYRKAKKSEPLTKVRQDALCRLHNWKEVKLVKADEYQTYMNSPNTISDKKYCATCGYVPEFEMMIKPEYLRYLAHHEEQKRKEEETIQLTKQITEDFFNENVKDASSEVKELLKKGYDLHATLVSILPLLVESRRFEKHVSQKTAR